MNSNDASTAGRSAAPILAGTPPPAVFAGLGLAGVGVGAYWLIATSWWWFPLKLLAFPALGLGLGALGVAWLKTKHRIAIEGYRPPALADAALQAAEAIEAALDGVDGGLTVVEMARETGVDGDEVVLGLGLLDTQGRLDEILDERTGEFRYALLDEPGDGDAASHVSLGQRLADVERRRGGRS